MNPTESRNLVQRLDTSSSRVPMRRLLLAVPFLLRLLISAYLVGIGPSSSLAFAANSTPSVTWAPTYYISNQNGDDSWSGTLAAPNATMTDGPFRTITRAQSAMKASSTIKAATLRAGTYSISSGWSLTSADNGELWISYPDEIAVLDGGSIGFIKISSANHITFMGLAFQNLGGIDEASGAGIKLSGSSYITLRWNNFTSCHVSCLMADGLSNYNIVDSNTFDGQSPGNPSGNIGHFYAAIEFWYGSSNNRITHNLVQNTQGGGILFTTGANDPPANSNIVDRNILKNVCNNVFDCGALYMYDASHSITGNQITNNIIDGNGGTGYAANYTHSIYLDDLMSHVLVNGNVCRNCGQHAFHIHAGNDNAVTNNIFDLSSPGTLLGLYDRSPLADYGMAGNQFQRNIVYYSGSAPNSLWQVGINPGDSLPIDSTNIYYSASGAPIPNTGVVDVNPFYVNPQFANPSSGNYSMPSNSPAFSLIQFQQLATDQGPVPYAPPGTPTPSLTVPVAPSALQVQ
jgi:hypothetical protein